MHFLDTKESTTRQSKSTKALAASGGLEQRLRNYKAKRPVTCQITVRADVSKDDADIVHARSKTSR